ncbi:MAG: TIGR02452 family protein [Candidatus Colwellbacteria bacterium]|nr:TIGR02452 family protein [Candidatus Colwellbacteria bacterium]
MSSAMSSRRSGKGRSVPVNPFIAVCRDTQKRFGQILKSDVRVRNGIKNTKHYDWTYPCRDSGCKTAPKNNTTIEFYNRDTIDCARQLQLRGLKVAAMNMANPDTPTNWESGARAQEECLMYRSTYALSLDEEYEIFKGRQWSYPLKEIGGVYSPDNLVIKDCNFEMYERKEMFYMDFVAIAGLRGPETKKKRMVYEYDIETTKEKMRAFFRICHMNSVDCPVAGALGCGVFGNPPEHIGLLWSEVINEPEFRHMFKVIVFAILDGKTTNNFGILQDRIKFNDSKDDTDNEIDWDTIDELADLEEQELRLKYHEANIGTDGFFNRSGDQSPHIPSVPTTSPSDSPYTTSPFQFTFSIHTQS